jgi:patatin-like phospholipase/acyl hydrolase
MSSADAIASVVLAITKDNVDARPTLFKTYDGTKSFEDCTIWQVARATSAATTFFKSIKCGRDEIEFIDAGFGYNNPCEVLIEEAKKTFPAAGEMQVLSIGTGLGDVVTIKDNRFSILNALKKMASSSKQVTDRLSDEYGNGCIYFRFNVDRGLQDITLADWENRAPFPLIHLTIYTSKIATSKSVQLHSHLARYLRYQRLSRDRRAQPDRQVHQNSQQRSPPGMKRVLIPVRKLPEK